MEDQQGSSSLKSAGKNLVFIVSIIITAAIVIWGIFGGESFEAVSSNAMGALTSNFDWIYIFGMTFFVLFALVIAISPLGKTRLGKDDERPKQSRFGWFAMLFAAGMGIGMVFWGISEPLSHYVAPMAGIDPMTDAAARFSMRSCIMHWGIHPWGCYAIVGMCLGYFVFRRGHHSLVSCTLRPIFTEKLTKGPVGIVVDIYAALLTVIGVATSFGMGCLQISSGLDYIAGIPNMPATWAILIGVICIVYTWSAVSGIDKAMQKLSNFTMIMCVVLIVLAFVVGPHIPAIQAILVGIGDYITNFFQDALRMQEPGGGNAWILGWRVFYWAWWLSWAPFVGIFVARISRGRTIREFVIGVMIAPTIVSALWFGVLGSLAFEGAKGMSADTLSTLISSPETTLFVIFNEFPLGIVLSIIALILLFAFFVTSANSATYVLAMLTSFGNVDPPNVKKVFWGVLMGLVAFVLCISGGVSGIQTIAIVISYPFFFIMVLMCISLTIALIQEKRGKVSIPTLAEEEAQAAGAETEAEPQTETTS